MRLTHPLRLLREPIPLEKKDLLRRRWNSLDARWRVEAQGYGQQATGCGATVGIQPRCDFDCTGCYLGEGANRVAPLRLEEIFRQLDRLRDHLGPKGNVQITDGEVTLLPREDLAAILRHARSIGLIPMLMTHGDTFRRRPDLLPFLVLEGRLTEVAIHVDSTQRGRRGHKGAANEAALMPLREEFAAMIRRVRSSTGRPLRAATTLTITRENLDAVPGIVDWCLRNRDAFGLISFQPVARVGRTREELESVGSDDLWERIARGLAPYGFRMNGRPPFLFGHPACTRLEALTVYQYGPGKPRVLQILRDGRPEDEEIVRQYFARGLGGVNFRDDSGFERACRILGIFLANPAWLMGPARRWFSSRIAALGTGIPGLLLDIIRRRVRMDGFTVTSHHFMSRDEIDTPKGRERLAACVFRVPIDGRMVAMCEVNAAGGRETVYARAEARNATAERVPVLQG